MEKSSKNIFILTGIISIITGLLPIIGFQLLASFGYPDIIRETPSVILDSLYKARDTVPYLYYIGIGGAGLGIFFLVILLSKIFQESGDDIWGNLGKYCGMVNGLCLYGGIIRWTFLFPLLAKLRAEGVYESKTVELVFEAFNTYIGDSIAEHVGFTFMFFWIIFFCIAILKTGVLNRWIALIGIIISMIAFYGNLEFFGAPGAFIFNRIGAELVAVWIIALGINLIWKWKHKIKIEN